MKVMDPQKSFCGPSVGNQRSKLSSTRSPNHVAAPGVGEFTFEQLQVISALVATN